jgi:hypothetical protein
VAEWERKVKREIGFWISKVHSPMLTSCVVDRQLFIVLTDRVKIVKEWENEIPI